MKLAAIVPLNNRASAKTRLAGVLEPRARASLSRWLARRVLLALREAQVADIGVVSPDENVLGWAWQNGAQPIRQDGTGLNAALDVGRSWALQRDAEALLVVLGDLPLLTADDVRTLVANVAEAPSGPTGPLVAIAPDRAEQGTNMLLLRPPTAIPFAFGEDSLARHIALTRGTGSEPRIVHLPGAAFDVDTPDDIGELAARGLWQPPTTPPRSLAGEAS
jgi:2-phospho-L-lactate/phosphoenolpyruvate guanylyltransferase